LLWISGFEMHVVEFEGHLTSPSVCSITLL
jgi:hypothetical protein